MPQEINAGAIVAFCRGTDDVSKTNLALSSLIAAIPGGFLAYLLVMAFLHHIGDMPMMLKVLVGLALIGCVVATLSPVGILVFVGGDGATKPKKAKESKKKSKDLEEDDDDMIVDEDDDLLLDEGDDFADDDDDLGFDDAAVGEGDDFELDFDEDE